jgi:O-antigen/teichoic acid export membrane protein
MGEMSTLLDKTSAGFRLSLPQRLQTIAPTILRDYWERLRASPVGYRLAKGAIWSLTGTVVSRTLTLLSSIFVARMLGKHEFGELGVIQNTVGMFGVFAGFGMGLTATKHVAEYRSTDPQRAGRVLVLTETVTVGGSLLAVLLLVMTAPLLARYALAAPQLARLLQLGALLVPFMTLNGVQLGALAGFEAFRAVAKVSSWCGLLSFPCLVLGAYVGGTTGTVVGLILSQAIGCALNNRALRKEARRLGIGLSLAPSIRERGVLFNFSLPAVCSNALGWFANWLCTALLVNQANGYADMGTLSAANQWRSALMFLPGILINAVLPILSNENSQPHGSFGRVMVLSHRLLAILVLPLTLLTMLGAGPIMRLYGAGFEEGRPALVYILAATAIAAISSPVGSAIEARARMKLLLWLTVLNALVFLLLTYCLVSAMGPTGLALGYLIANAVQTLAAYSFLRAELPEGFFARNMLSVLAICSLAFLVLLL